MRLIDADEYEKRIKPYDTEDAMDKALYNFAHGKLITTPTAQPEAKEIGYAECANAMLKMWIDNVLTDGEYNRIMDKLNAHHNAERRQDGQNIIV